MPIIDCHAHIIVPEITNEADPSDGWRPRVTWEDGQQVVAFAGKSIRSALREFVHIDAILTEQDRAGVDRVLLAPWVSLLRYDAEPQVGLGTCRIYNEALSRLAQVHPQRVSALGAVPLQDADLAARELESVMALPGLCGVEIAASICGDTLGADRFAQFWAAAEASGALVFVHPTTRGFGLPVMDEYYLWNTVGNPLETTISAAHMIMAGVMERHPGLKVLLAHGGGAILALRGRLAHAHSFQPQARQRLTESPLDSLRRFYYDTVTHDPGVLRALVDVVGADHVVLGSDYPFDMGDARPADIVEALDLPADFESCDPGRQRRPPAQPGGLNMARLFTRDQLPQFVSTRDTRDRLDLIKDGVQVPKAASARRPGYLSPRRHSGQALPPGQPSCVRRVGRRRADVHVHHRRPPQAGDGGRDRPRGGPLVRERHRRRTSHSSSSGPRLPLRRSGSRTIVERGAARAEFSPNNPNAKNASARGGKLMGESYDVVVAGAGHNSLICAAYLARAGLRVLVLEAGQQIGGNTMTEELTVPGYWHDSCSSAHVLIQSSPTIRNNELGLDRYGLKYLHPDPAVTMPFDDGSSLTMWLDLERTVAEFGKFSKRDGEAYRRLIAEYDSVKKVFGQNRYTPVGYGPSLDEALMQRPDGALWVRRYKQTALEIVNAYFEDDHVRAFMLWMAFMTIQPIDRPQTGRLAYAVANGRQHYSWTTPVGGSGSLPKALAALIADEGGTVLTGKQIVRLIIEGGRCVGVVTADGEQFRADKAVVSSIHIKHLVDMAPTDAWGDIFVQGVEQWQPGFTLFAAHYALSEPPLYPIDGERRPSVAAGLAGSTDNMLRLMSDTRRGLVHQDDPSLLVVCSTVADETRTPPGGHTLKVLSFFPYDLADGGPARWDDIKHEVAQRNLDYLRRFAPNLTDKVILGSHIESPLDLERRNLHNWHGSCHGGELSPAQSGANRPVPGWASHRMPIKGLYQTGATTHPGGSVSGGPGRNAARVVLDDLGLSLDAAIAAGGAAQHA